MNLIEENKSLKSYNTFGVEANARYFIKVESAAHIDELLAGNILKNNNCLILGGGSNILFTGNYDGLIVHNCLKGINTVHETATTVEVEVMAGENWHHIVTFALQNDWGGLENLSLIPGLAGAAPIQNIGAYGVEVKDMITQVHGIDLRTGLHRTLGSEECAFGYRDSIFKHELKEFFFISSITLSLTKKHHRIATSYGAINDVLKQQQITKPTIQQVSNAVQQIRRSKLPDPTQLGNAGSFFKNPVVSETHYKLLQQEHPEIPGYKSVNQEVKVPAGWLIEQCGWKGKRIGNCGVHTQQALVLVNYGDSTGNEILELAMRIIASVKSKFNIELQCEVNIK
ncbi:MAG: UDP-N-acetylmuramate dehydrogenase [Cytophagales bacterium]|nr:UDP-N-acetylmuramate dehydrogenase [Cytophagales bacterium]